MSELIKKTASELIDLLQSGGVSSVEITQAHLDQIAKVDSQIHSFLVVNAQSALATAKDVDARRKARCCR